MNRRYFKIEVEKLDNEHKYKIKEENVMEITGDELYSVVEFWGALLGEFVSEDGNRRMTIPNIKIIFSQGGKYIVFIGLYEQQCSDKWWVNAYIKTN